jgi:hypothetical protein
MLGLRLLAALGAALAVAGWVVGWFARGDADAVADPLAPVRPDAVVGAGPLAWLLLAVLIAAPLIPYERRPLAVAWPAAAAALVATALAAVLRPRAAVTDETVGELVVDRPIGQTLSLCGALVVVMALVAAWRRAPDWRVPPRWAGASAPADGPAPTAARHEVTEP